MIPTPSLRKQAQGLCKPVSGLPVSYASLSDGQLARLSSFYVALQEGLKCYPELYNEIQLLPSGKEEDPFATIYAELVHRITGATDERSGKPALVHALYQQAICAYQENYGKYGEEEWVYAAVFDALEHLQPDNKEQYDYAVFDLTIDIFHILGAFEPEDKEIIDTALTKWNAALAEDGWASLPINEVARRLRFLTAYYDLSHTDLVNPAAKSVCLLERFCGRIEKEADADTLITYREALRNVYCYQTVHTAYFERLEQTAKSLPGGFSSAILSGLLRIDRLERELADL